MKDGMMFNSRLFPPEFGLWHEMCDTLGVEKSDDIRRCTESFGTMDDVFLYVATLGGVPIGGTALYRDRTLLGLALAAVFVEESRRGDVLRSIIRSSLPFFRTAAIRQVDALVPEETTSAPPFPFSFLLPEWTAPALADLRFSQVDEDILYGDLTGPFPRPKSNVDWDESHDINAVRKFLWRRRRDSSVNCSHTWLSADLGAARGRLHTLSIDGDLALVLVSDTIGSHLVLRLLVRDPSRVDEQLAADAVLGVVRQARVETLSIDLLSPYERGVIDIVSHDGKRTNLLRLALYRRLL